MHSAYRCPLLFVSVTGHSQQRFPFLSHAGVVGKRIGTYDIEIPSAVSNEDVEEMIKECEGMNQVGQKGKMMDLDEEDTVELFEVGINVTSM